MAKGEGVFIVIREKGFEADALLLKSNTNTFSADAIIGEPTGVNVKVNIGDVWKDVTAVKINIGDSWKEVTSIKQNIGDSWKTV